MTPNFNRMPLSDYSLSLGESLSKFGRHRLCRLCLREIEKKCGNPFPEGLGRGRGRPKSPATILAIRVGVSYDSVLRWQNPEAIQSCDSNAVKLARIAYEYNPGETIEILRQDLECHREAIEGWVSQMNPVQENFLNGDRGQTQNIVACPCVENTEAKEGA